MTKQEQSSSDSFFDEYPVSTFRLPLFQFLNEQEILDVLKLGKKETYLKDSLILEEEKTCDYLYIILSGKVNVVKSSFSQEKYVATLGPGSSIGEMSLFTDGIASATVKAFYKDVDIFIIEKDKLMYYFEKNLEVGNKILRGLVNELSERLKMTTFEKVTMTVLPSLQNV